MASGASTLRLTGALLLTGSLAGSCTLFLDEDERQCATTSDCVARGVEFADLICDPKRLVCVPGRLIGDAGQDSSDESDSAVPDAGAMDAGAMDGGMEDYCETGIGLDGVSGEATAANVCACPP